MEKLLELLDKNDKDIIATIHYCMENNLIDEASQLFHIFACQTTCGLSEEDYQALIDFCYTCVEDLVEMSN